MSPKAAAYRRKKLLQKLTDPNIKLMDPIDFRDRRRARDKKQPSVDLKRY